MKIIKLILNIIQKIKYYKSSENRNKISNYRIKINDCQKDKYYYGTFNKK